MRQLRRPTKKTMILTKKPKGTLIFTKKPKLEFRKKPRVPANLAPYTA